MGEQQKTDGHDSNCKFTPKSEYDGGARQRNHAN